LELSQRKAPKIIAAGRHFASPAAFSLIRGLLLIGVLLAISACPKDPLRGKGPEAEKARVLVTVNGQQITERDFNLRLLNSGLSPGKLLSLTEEQAAMVKKELLKNLIDSRLLLQYAAGEAFAPTEEQVAAEVAEIKKSYDDSSWIQKLDSFMLTEAEWIDSVRNRLTALMTIERIMPEDIIITQAEIEDYLAAAGGQQVGGAEIVFRQVFCNDEQTANNALARLNDGAEFAAIAAEFSKAPEAANGGLVGPVTIAILPQELKRQLLALQPGERSVVFQSEYGYHIVEPVEIKSEQRHNEEKGKELARAALLANKKEEVFRRWVVQRRRGAQIEIINQLP
jgi:parvulin-like peptidyl-prolyl isomerase